MDGTVLSDAVNVSGVHDHDQNRPVVASLKDGRIVVGWRREENGGADTYIRLTDEQFSPLTAPVRVNVHDGGYHVPRDLATFKDGSFVVLFESYPKTWCSDTLGQDGDCNGIFAQRFDADGNKLYH